MGGEEKEKTFRNEVGGEPKLLKKLGWVGWIRHEFFGQVPSENKKGENQRC